MKVNNKKNEIIDVAYNLFISNGYENTSVDEIISKLGIAKGTFFYYFETKEILLENVIDKLIKKEEEKALYILNSEMSIEEKLVGIIAAMRPESNEFIIEEELNKNENLIMHQKINEKIIDTITPLLKKVIEEGVKKEIFKCDNISERIKIILIISNQIFDSNEYNKEMITVFIDTVEKILGAKQGTMMFITKLIDNGGI